MKYRRGVMIVLMGLFLVLIPEFAMAGLEEGLAAAKKDDYVTTLKEFKPLAKAGNAQAQFYLGNMYYNGIGVSQNYKEAMRLYFLAAAQGNADAQSSIGAVYYNGRGMPQNYKEAMKWYRLAAAQGNSEAQLTIGSMYSDGDGVPENVKEAMKWYRPSAAQGNAIAQLKMGVLYDYGFGVPSSSIVAYALYIISAVNDPSAENLATKYRNRQGAFLNRKDVEEGQELAREMSKPGNFLNALDTYMQKNNKVKKKKK